jgi:TRAP transporter TAXI family solute receptor
MPEDRRLGDDRAIRVDRDDKVPRSRSRRNARRYLRLAGAILLAAIPVAIASFIAFIYPTVPRVVVMATGAEGGAYAEFGERYREFFARQGVALTLVHTRGSIENLAMLRYSDFGVSIALVQNGLADPAQYPDLVSLGTVAFEPLWIFCRAQSPRDRLDQLQGMQVSIGPTGSGMRRLALDLLARSGIDESNTDLLPLPTDLAASRLIEGDIEAAMIVASSDAPAVRRLLASPEVKLMSLAHADTYVALFPFLSKLVLPAGFADLAHDRPPADVEMVAVKASLVVRRDLQSPVQFLLLDAATRIHAHPGVFQKAGQFPAAETTDLPLGDNARDFYKSGLPLLQRYLPLWLAVLIEQLAITLIPMASVAYPLLRTAPAVYSWRVRRRIYRLYGELKLLELTHDDVAGERPSDALLSDLTKLEHRVNRLRVPASFAHMLYTLRHDIGLVRARLDQSTP